jgi:eukaryotic-like serine/threonine-protein kinase
MASERFVHMGNDDDLNQLIGQQLDQFQITERIGSGGMATVFKAYQPSLDRYVAIKVLPIRHAQDPVFFKRFVQEARSIARLAHPNIVHIYNFGEQDLIKYIAMEYVDGGTLKERLKQPLPLKQAINFVIQAAKGLDCAHRNGIIHRDIKPANMLVRDNGHLLLTDFGLAKILEETTNITKTGAHLGTPHYMSPEQGTGHTIDSRTDIYSLGIVLFHCLAGEPPFHAENALSMSVKHVHEPLPADKLVREHNVPVPIVQIIVKMTAKKPQDRYQSATELVDVLSDALATVGSGSLSNQSNAPLPARQVYDLPPQAPLICFRCNEPNARTHRHCIICGDDLSNKGASADRYLAPNGRPIVARLLLQTGTMEGRAFRFHQNITTIGRLAGNDFIIIGPTVSRRHAQLSFFEGRWYVEDLQSGNGTQVNGQRIYGRTLLKDGDIINFGDERAVFTMVTDG